MSKINCIQLGILNYYSRKNVHLIKFVCKCFLLSVSGLVFLYLLISTISYRKKHEFNEFMYESMEERQVRLRLLLEQNYRLKWNHETVYLYKKELGLEEKEENYVELEENEGEKKIATGINQHQTHYESNSGSNYMFNKTINSNTIYTLPKHMAMVCAFPGNTLHDHMWEYLSLWAIHDQYPDVISTVSVKTSNSLKRLLKPINMAMISEINESDYDLAYAKIIGHITPILPIETFENKKVPLLMERFTKRHTEIINGDLINLRQFVKFNSKIIQKSNTEMNKIKIRHGFNATDNNVYWVGIYIDDSTIPVNYYRSAILHFLQHNTRTVFIVICSPDAMQYYITGLGFHSTKFRHPFARKFHIMAKARTGSHAEIMEFMLMSLCNSTIISNTNGALHALLNGGVATFYRPNNSIAAREHNIPHIIGKRIVTWLEIT